MARLISRGPDVRLPSTRGRYIVRKWRGKDVIAAWPTPRGQKLSPKQREAVEKFKQANEAAHYVNPIQQNTMREITAGTGYLPRDLIISAMYGRFPAVIYRQGRNYYSMAARNDVSEVLDAVAQDPGDILVRGPTWWTPLAIGAPGQYLQVAPGGTALQWAAPPSSTKPIGCYLVASADGPESITWPKYPTFDVVHYDDAGLFNPANPDRVTIPAGIQYARFSFTAIYTASTTSRSFFFGLERDLSGNALLATSTNIRAGSTGFNNNTFIAATGIRQVAPGEVYRLRLNCSPAYEAGWLANTVLAVEVWG